MHAWRMAVTTSVGALALAAMMVASPAAAQTPEAAPAAAPAAKTFHPLDTAMKAELATRVDALLDSKGFEKAHWGVLITSLDTGDTWYERNADRLFMPASNQKILTTSAALLTLGPDFRFRTEVSHSGTIEGGVLKGDLVVRGDGDPTLYGGPTPAMRFFDDTRQVFRAWAAELKKKGITRITGRVIGDDDAWDDEHRGDGWPERENDAWYYAEYGPLTLTENVLDLTITPPANPGERVRVEPNVPSGYYTIDNQVTAVADDAKGVRISRPWGTNRIVIKGSVEAGAKAIEESCTITNPTAFYATVLRETLAAEGITIDGAATDIDDAADWKAARPATTTLITHDSPPLGEIAARLMKRSQNMYSETMIHRLAMTRGDGPATFDGGVKVLEEKLESLGVAPTAYHFSDGSGLSRYNLVSPRALSQILASMTRTPVAQAWHDSFPIAGVDGTLRSRMKGTPAEGNVRAKTGTLFAVRGLSGYVTTAQGETLVVSILVNHFLAGSAAVNNATDPIMATLAGFDGIAWSREAEPKPAQ